MYWKSALQTGGVIHEIVTVSQNVLVHPSVVVIVKQVTYDPFVANVFDAFWVVAVDPSPNCHSQLEIDPGLEVEASK